MTAFVPLPVAGVEVQTSRHCLRADAVVVTVPLGVLKRGDEALRFSPPLTQRKRDAIGRLGFGAMNKVGRCAMQHWFAWRRVAGKCRSHLTGKQQDRVLFQPVR
jgi:monoamine oxidase